MSVPIKIFYGKEESKRWLVVLPSADAVNGKLVANAGLYNKWSELYLVCSPSTNILVIDYTPEQLDNAVNDMVARAWNGIERVITDDAACIDIVAHSYGTGVLWAMMNRKPEWISINSAVCIEPFFVRTYLVSDTPNPPDIYEARVFCYGELNMDPRSMCNAISSTIKSNLEVLKLDERGTFLRVDTKSVLASHALWGKMEMGHGLGLRLMESNVPIESDEQKFHAAVFMESCVVVRNALMRVQSVEFLDALVTALWYNATNGEDSVWSLLTSVPDAAEIRRVLATTKRFDYLSGRAIKIDFSRYPFDAKQYDGFGYKQSFKEVFETLL